MPFSIPWGLVLRYGLPALLIGGLVYWGVNSLIEVGEANVQEKWDAEVAAHEKKIQDLEKKVRDNEAKHRTETQRIEDRLVASDQNYRRRLADSRIAHSGELRRAEGRSAVYQRMSDAGATERANLASHAAQLDRSLVEGRQVVEELRATVVQRDEQLRAVGEQLAADRELIGGN